MGFAWEGEHACQPRTDLIQRQDLGCRTQFRSGFWHSIDCAADRVLGNGMMSASLECEQTLGPVAAHSGKNYPHDIALPNLVCAFEENIDRRSIRAIHGIRRIVKRCGCSKDQMILTARQQDCPGARTFAVL